MKRLEGLYLVVDTTIPPDRLLSIVEKALQGGVDILQLWGTWKDADEAKELGENIVSLTHRHGALLLTADDVELCQMIKADGVHFDGYPLPALTPAEVKKELGNNKYIGVTVGNNREKLLWAERYGADYVSFCSIFSTASVDTCEIVPLEMIREAKRLLSIPVFASGGITLQNIDRVLEAGADGIAVVSAILNAADPRLAAQEFKERIRCRRAARAVEHASE